MIFDTITVLFVEMHYSRPDPAPVATGTLRGALTGAISGAALGAIGKAGFSQFDTAVASGAAGGIFSDLQGGQFGHGFISAGLSSGIGGDFSDNVALQVLTSAVVGGTVSTLSGGKFGNGAGSAAFAASLRADWGGAFGRGDNGIQSLQKRADTVRDNLTNLAAAKEYVDQEYKNLLEGVEIKISILDDSAIGEACVIQDCIEINFKNIMSGKKFYSKSKLIDTLVHEGLHLKVNQELGTLNYLGSEVKAILGGSIRGSSHQWIYDQGNAAGRHSLAPESSQKPDISMRKFRQDLGIK